MADPSHGTAPGWPLAEVVTRLRRALRAGVRADYPWERLPMAQVELLQRLADEPGLRVSDLAARHRLAPNTVSNLVQQLVQSGLVVRTADPGDRRAVVITLTRAGEAQLQGWLDANSRRLAAALERLSARDRNAILRIVPALTRLVDALESGEP
ncbi:MAG: MarR family transcriptional regulator [Jatrophihabitans sp.]|nr:MAG: MarR family transcriptional regulator [Jatrophihabitans sp.]